MACNPCDSRRGFLHRTARLGLAAAGMSTLTSEALADMLATPRLTEGPFYPDRMPLDTDNDLVIVGDSISPALGQITHLSGRVLSKAGEPLRNAVVEVWQVDHNGAYLHTADRNARRDANFQGYGRFLTDAAGRYYFRTIKPTPYPGRTPHIHVAVSLSGRRVLTSQFFTAGERQNQRDGIYRSLSDEERRLVTLNYQPLEESKIGELMAEGDLVIGRTPAEDEQGRFPGVVAAREAGSRRGAPGGRAE